MGYNKLRTFVLLLVLLLVEGGKTTVAASSLSLQEAENNGSTTRITEDVLFTIRASVMMARNDENDDDENTNEKKKDEEHHHYMIDNLSLIKASMEELIKTNRRTTTAHGQVLSFHEMSECPSTPPYNEDDPTNSSNTCLKVKARFVKTLLKDSKASPSSPVRIPAADGQRPSIEVRSQPLVPELKFPSHDDEATSIVTVIKNNIEVMNWSTSTSSETVTSILPVRMIVTKLFSSLLCSNCHDKIDHNKNYTVLASETPQDEDDEKLMTRLQDERMNERIIGGSSSTLMLRRQLFGEQSSTTNDYYEFEQQAPSTKSSSSSATSSTSDTTTSKIGPGAEYGLIVGLVAVTLLLFIACVCAIYSTRTHKYDPYDYFDHPLNDDNSHPHVRESGAMEGDSRHRHVNNSDRKKMNRSISDDDDDVAEEVSSLVASAAVSIGYDPEQAVMGQQRRSNKTSGVQQYLASKRNVDLDAMRRESSSTSADAGKDDSTSPASTFTVSTKTRTVTPWYAPPIQRQYWGETQVLPHINWGDIFFDLFYVGAAYNFGVLLISLADDGSLHIWPRGIMYYVGMFGSLMLIWNKKTIFDSKYTVVDTIHRWSDMVRVCFLAVSIMHIETFEIMSNPVKANTFNFMLGLTLEQCVTLAIQLEVAVRGMGSKACHIEARNTILIQQLPMLTVYLVALGISIYSHFLGPDSLYQHNEPHDSSYSETDDQYNATNVTDNYNVTAANLTISSNYGNQQNNSTYDKSYDGRRRLGEDGSSGDHRTMMTLTLDDAPYIILFCSYLAYQIILFIYTRFYLPSKKHMTRDIQTITTPVNVDFIVHRYGEWTMLMLGESVMSLLVVETVEIRDYYIVAAAGLIMVILLQVLHFESEPSTAHTTTSEHGGQAQHALVRNKMSSLGFYYSTHLHSFALIALGASFKVMLQIVHYMYESNPTLSSPEAYHSHDEQSSPYHLADSTSSNNNHTRFLRNGSISHGSSAILPRSSSAPSSSIGDYNYGSSSMIDDRSIVGRFLAKSTSTQGINDSYEVKAISANMFGISLALVLISMELMSFSHRGFQTKKEQYQSSGVCTRIAAFFISILRIGFIFAAGTLSVYLFEPKSLVLGGMIIVFLSVVVKSNGKDLLLVSRLSSLNKK